ncbi:MAG: DUF899 family protein [Geminicoccaceae bacterium]
MNYQEGMQKLAADRRQIEQLRERMRTLRSEIEPQPVEDYSFKTTDAEVKLSDLFGPKNELFVVHNMGRSCPYCTLWADGFNGVYQHLADRAAFVVATPDTPDVQAEFADSRGWRFPMVSHAGTSFAADMGYKRENGGLMPGVSAFRKEGDRVMRVADAGFGPGDDFCAVWHFFDLLPEGSNGWQAKYRYS